MDLVAFDSILCLPFYLFFSSFLYFFLFRTQNCIKVGPEGLGISTLKEDVASGLILSFVEATNRIYIKVNMVEVARNRESTILKKPKEEFDYVGYFQLLDLVNGSSIRIATFQMGEGQ